MRSVVVTLVPLFLSLFLFHFFLYDNTIQYQIQIIERDINLNNIRQQGKPAIIKNAINHWSALTEWVPLHDEGKIWTVMDKNFPVELKNISVNGERFFTYFQNRPMSTIDKISQLQNSHPSKINLKTGEYLEILFDKNKTRKGDEEFYYYSTKLKEFPKLLEKIKAEEWYLDDFAFTSPPTSPLDEMKIFLWMGLQGVTTRLHYDWSYNVLDFPI